MSATTVSAKNVEAAGVRTDQFRKGHESYVVDISAAAATLTPVFRVPDVTIEYAAGGTPGITAIAALANLPVGGSCTFVCTETGPGNTADFTATLPYGVSVSMLQVQGVSGSEVTDPVVSAPTASQRVTITFEQGSVVLTAGDVVCVRRISPRWATISTHTALASTISLAATS